MKSLYEIKIAIKKRFWFLHKSHYGKFGKRSCIYKPMCVIGKKYVQLEENVFIRNGARIECVTKWHGEHYSPNIHIGKNTVIEQNVHFTSAGNLFIGENCCILANTMITNINHDYSVPNLSVAQQAIHVKDTSIGNNCFVGMGAKIFPGCHIGDNCIIGANSILLEGDYPAYSVIVGVPAKVIKRYNFTTKLWEKCKFE